MLLVRLETKENWEHIARFSNNMIDLKVNRQLINTLFNGYKLANEQLHTASVDVPAIDEGAKNSSHFSYAYSKATQLHNHLYKNPWDNSVYFIDQDLNIQRVTHNKVNFFNFVSDS